MVFKDRKKNRIRIKNSQRGRQRKTWQVYIEPLLSLLSQFSTGMGHSYRGAG
jgi:hypothetical protein